MNYQESEKLELKSSFGEWNKIKKKINISNKKVFFKERDVFYVALGKNVGCEQNGKNEKFSRPVIVLRKFNNNIFLAVPLTTKIKNGEFYFNFFINNRDNSAILSQIKLIDSKRIIKKIGMIPTDSFRGLKIKIGRLLKLSDL